MENNTTYQFRHGGWDCSIERNDYGFWGSAESQFRVIKHMFPDETFEIAVKEIVFSIDSNDYKPEESEEYYDYNCHVCGGCSVCGASCTFDCTCLCDIGDFEDESDE